MRKGILLATMFILGFTGVFAQDFEVGKAAPEELTMKSYDWDKNARAVVLNEFGEVRISDNPETPLIHRYHVKIKVFDTGKFEHGEVVIPLHKSESGTREALTRVEAYSSSWTSEGGLKRQALDPSKIYREEKSKTLTLVKFAIPNITNGAVIEYLYEVNSPFVFNLPTWQFQWDIPKMKSMCIVHIPGLYTYNIVLRGELKLTSNKADLERECFSMRGVNVDCSRLTYAMETVPAFIREDYMTAPSNFISAIYFELMQYQDLNGVVHKVTNEWKNVDQQLKSDPEFGGQLKNGDVFKAQLASIAADTKTPLDKAKAIYSMVKSAIKWNGRYFPYSPDGIKKAVDARSGTIGDVNLALTAALIEAGFEAEAVLLSTRDNGTVHKVYPVIGEFDYVITRLTIDNQVYLLDASEPLMSFGLIPVRCLNDQGRAMSRTKPSFWIDMKPEQKETRTMNADLALNESGKITGKMICYSKGYEAFSKRLAIRKFNSPDEYVEDLDEKMPRIKILKYHISNLDSLDNTLSEEYDMEIDAFNSLEKGTFLLSPFFMIPMKENPFKLVERNYPVDWGAPSDYRFAMTLQLPPGYKLVNQFMPVGLALPLAGGKYIANVTATEDRLNIAEVLQIDKAIYGSGEYFFLKELFNKIVQVRNTELIFKKQ